MLPTSGLLPVLACPRELAGLFTHWVPQSKSLADEQTEAWEGRYSHPEVELAMWVGFDQTRACCYDSTTDTVAGMMPGRS